jgi:hypothetical protein
MVPGTGSVPGGAVRFELLPDPPADGWVEFLAGWKGGSLLSFGFLPNGTLVAGSHSKGVLWLVPGAQPAWRFPKDDVGVPVRDEVVAGAAAGGADRDLHPIATLGVDSTGTIMAGTVQGVYRATDPAGRYVAVTERDAFPAELREFVTLPPTWLFRSGEHAVTVKSEDEALEGDHAGA